MNILTWGKVTKHEENTLIIEFFKNSEKYIYDIEVLEGYNHVIVKDPNNDNKILFDFTDHSENGSVNNFTRKIKNMVYIFNNNKISIKFENKQFKFIKPLKPAKKNFTKFLTFDIETRNINNQLTPYCICIYDGRLKYSFYLSDYKSSEAMINAAINVFFSKYKIGDQEIFRYNKCLIFAHNFSKFDSIFILKHLVKYVYKYGYKINILRKDTDFINISIGLGKFEINFRDSYLLLQSSLKKLAKSFNVVDKGIFPYEFVNDLNIPLNYSGKVPEYKYFSNISSEQYNEYVSSFNSKWKLKYETIKYCLKDCVILHRILIKFSREIYNDLGVTLLFAPTTSSLALRTYLTKFLDKDTQIPIIMGDVYNFVHNPILVDM